MNPGISWLDVKLGLRMLVRYPGLTLVGGLAMGFAIAVGAATFELFTKVVYPTLPLDEGDRVVGIRQLDAEAGGTRQPTLLDFAAWRDELRSVDHLGAFRTVQRNLSAPDVQAGPVAVAEISASAFQVARVPPLLGRHLVPGDEAAGAPAVLVIGHDAWRSRFGGDPEVVGRAVRLGASEATVVGVMPEGFAFPVAHGFWAPLRMNPPGLPRDGGPPVQVFGRLAPGASLGEAQAELATLGARAAAELPDTHQHLRPQVTSYARAYSPYQGEGIPWGLFTAAGYSINAAVLLFLLLVCANVATLVFARTATRESEMVVRSALGASRGRIAMQLFTEALVLGGVAAALGLAAAALGLRWSLRVFESVVGDLPFWISASITPRTVVYAGILTVLGALVVGVVPALRVSGPGLEARLRRRATGGASLRLGGVWTGIIATQVALTIAFVPMVSYAALDAHEIRGAYVGTAAEEFLSARLEVDRETPPNAPAGKGSHTPFQELKRRLEREPGVTGVVFASHLPGAHHPRRQIEVEGVAAPAAPSADRRVQAASVDADFFATFGAPVLAGRGFHAADLVADARVVVVNQEFVREFLGGRNAVGRRVRYPDAGGSDPEAPAPWYEIVGVVAQLDMSAEPGASHSAGVYHPLVVDVVPSLAMAVRVGDPESLAPRLRALAAAVDPGLRLYGLRPLDEVQRDLLTTYTFWIQVAALASCIVLLLTTTGLYSILSFTVARRTREIGIRIALGADRRRIVGTLLARAFAQVGLGIGVGTALLLVMAGAGGVRSPGEVGTLVACVALMAGVCALACVVPARRALRIEPTEAMRADA